MPRQINDHEKQVADLFFQFVRRSLPSLRNLAEFLVQLLEHLLYARPAKTDLGHFTADLLGLGQRGLGSRHGIEQRFCLPTLLAFFLGLYLVPSMLHDVRGLSHGVAEHVRMTADELTINRIERIRDSEQIPFGSHLGVKDALEHQVAQFFGQCRPVAGVNRVQDFVCLFECIGLNCVEILFAIPGTSVRTAQHRHDFDETIETFGRIAHCGKERVASYPSTLTKRLYYAPASMRCRLPPKIARASSSFMRSSFRIVACC